MTELWKANENGKKADVLLLSGKQYKEGLILILKKFPISGQPL